MRTAIVGPGVMGETLGRAFRRAYPEEILIYLKSPFERDI